MSRLCLRGGRSGGGGACRAPFPIPRPPSRLPVQWRCPPAPEAEGWASDRQRVQGGSGPRTSVSPARGGRGRMWGAEGGGGPEASPRPGGDQDSVRPGMRLLPAGSVRGSERWPVAGCDRDAHWDPFPGHPRTGRGGRGRRVCGDGGGGGGVGSKAHKKCAWEGGAQKPTAPGIPRRSPIQVLTRPDPA